MYISKGSIALEETVYEYIEEMHVNISVYSSQRLLPCQKCLWVSNSV